MRVIFFLVIVLLPLTSFSQDSVFQVRDLSSELSSSSQKSTEGKYFDYFTLRMAAGDRILLRYSSNDFVTEIGVQDSTGKAFKKDDEGMYTSNIGSSITLPFGTDTAKPFYFIFSSKEPEKTGKYTVKVIYYNKSADHITTNNSFCEKLNWIIENSKTNFEFIKRTRKQTAFVTVYNPTVQLINNLTCEIRDEPLTEYSCIVVTATTKTEADKVFDETLTKLNKCLTGYQSKKEKKDNSQETIFRKAGKGKNDLNASHALLNIEGEVILSNSKSGNNYVVEIKID